LTFVNKNNLDDLNDNSRYKKSRPKTGNKSIFDNSGKKSMMKSRSVIGNLKRAKNDGLYKTDYLVDHPIHHSDPPYIVIKPAYRAQLPISNDALDMKHSYSFKPFGGPIVERPSASIFKTVNR